MKMDKNDDNIDFLKTFDRNNAIANPEFRQSLRNRVMAEFQPTPVKSSFLGLSEFSLNFLSFALAAFSLVVVVSGGIYINSLNKLTKTSETVVASVPEAKKQEVLSNIIKNNSDTILLNEVIQSPPVATPTPQSTPVIANNTITASRTTAAEVSQEVVEVAKAQTITNNVKSFNYSVSKTTTKAGPRFEDCKINDVYDTKESSSYIDGSDIYKKEVISNKNETRTTSVIKNGNNITISKYYGGDYEFVINEKVQEEILLPTSFPISGAVVEKKKLSEGEVNNFYKDSIKGIEETTVGDKNSYVITTETKINCNGTIKNVIKNSTFDKNNFELAGIEYYLQSVGEKNLIEKESYSTQNSTLSKNQAGTMFMINSGKDSVYSDGSVGVYTTKVPGVIRKGESIGDVANRVVKDLVLPFNGVRDLGSFTFSDKDIYIFDKNFYGYKPAYDDFIKSNTEILTRGKIDDKEYIITTNLNILKSAPFVREEDGILNGVPMKFKVYKVDNNVKEYKVAEVGKGYLVFI